MALWVAISISLACLIVGFVIATWWEGACSDEMREENFRLLIENERLKRGGP